MLDSKSPESNLSLPDLCYGFQEIASALKSSSYPKHVIEMLSSWLSRRPRRSIPQRQQTFASDGMRVSGVSDSPFCRDEGVSAEATACLCAEP